MKSLQQKYFSKGICFGCGPQNPQGLQINSYPKDDEVICDWFAKPYHQAFEGMLNGGIIGALLDCHCNWTGAYTLMQSQKLEKPPCTVTAEYTIKLLRPTPAHAKIHLTAKPIKIEGRRVIVAGELSVNDEICANCTGIFVAVKPGHPAYHRW